jgi:hypothetical protein
MFCSKNKMCPELEPVLSQCQNKREGTCNCKYFCRQQMEMLKNFIADSKQVQLQDRDYGA